MKYAVIRTGSKQYKVKEGQQISVEKLVGKEGSTIKLEEVLLVVDGENRNVGSPLVKNAFVSAQILAQAKGEKIRVATFKAKSRYRRAKGHRQKLTLLQIEKIALKSGRKATKIQTSKAA